MESAAGVQEGFSHTPGFNKPDYKVEDHFTTPPQKSIFPLNDYGPTTQSDINQFRSQNYMNPLSKGISTFKKPKGTKITSKAVQEGTTQSFQAGEQRTKTLTPYWYGLNEKSALNQLSDKIKIVEPTKVKINGEGKVRPKNDRVNLITKEINKDFLQYKYGYQHPNTEVKPGTQSRLQYAPDSLIRPIAKGYSASGYYAGFPGQKTYGVDTSTS